MSKNFDEAGRLQNKIREVRGERPKGTVELRWMKPPTSSGHFIGRVVEMSDWEPNAA